MTVEKFYSRIHGNYEEAMERFKSDEKILKFLTIFGRDENYAKLCEALENKNYEDAFLNAHTLKGMCANLSMTALFEETRILTEQLRGGRYSAEAGESFEKVTEMYIEVRRAIEELCNGE